MSRPSPWRVLCWILPWSSPPRPGCGGVPGRKVVERKPVLGEAPWPALGPAGSLLGSPVEFDPSARVRWKPARTRNMLAVAELVVMLHERLNIPVEPLIEHLPFDSQDLDEFSRYIRRSPDAVESLPEDSE